MSVHYSVIKLDTKEEGREHSCTVVSHILVERTLTAHHLYTSRPYFEVRVINGRCCIDN